MVRFYKNDNGDIMLGSGIVVPDGFTKYTQDNIPSELQVFFNKKNELSTIEHFKSLYLEIFNAKLKELDYDSIATVQLWMSDATFGTEATKIMTWYKALINKNYEILTIAKASGVIPTDEDYIASLPKFI